MFRSEPLLRKQIGRLSLLLGGLCVLAASLIGGFNYIRRLSVADQEIATVTQCDTDLKSFAGSTVEHVGDDTLTVSWPTVAGGYSRLGDASAAALACPGWTMKAFCMGQACRIPGAQLTLEKLHS